MGYKRFIRKIAKFVLASQPDTFTKVEIAQIQYGGILKDKKIVITGGGSGLGYAMAEKFISEGAQVVISGRNQNRLEKAASELGINCRPVVFDVCEVEQISDFLESSRNALNGTIDLLSKYVNSFSFTSTMLPGCPPGQGYVPLCARRFPCRKL